MQSWKKFLTHDDTNPVMSEFGFKIYVDHFCKIRHTSQTVHQSELKFYREILDTRKYIISEGQSY
jgi:hypothetical protein